MGETCIQMAKEYKCILEKMNTSIQCLKDELAMLKRQDVKLLKKFIHINEEIKSFQHNKYGDELLNLYNNSVFGLHAEQTNIPIIRRQSLPYFCRIQRLETLCSTGSSLEDLTEYIDDESPALSAGINGKETVFRFPGKLMPEFLNAGSRCRSLSCAVDLNSTVGVDDTELENILFRNVELWKFSKNDTDIGFINRNSKNDVGVLKKDNCLMKMDNCLVKKDNCSDNLNIPTILLTSC